MADNFNIAKFLKENSLGSYGILGKYIDLQPLKEADKDSGYDDESGPATANEAANSGQASLELDWAASMPLLKSKCKKHGLTFKVVEEFGPGGGNPLIKIIGPKENIIAWLNDGYVEDEEDLELFVDDIQDESMNEAAQEYDSEETRTLKVNIDPEALGELDDEFAIRNNVKIQKPKEFDDSVDVKSLYNAMSPNEKFMMGNVPVKFTGTIDSLAALLNGDLAAQIYGDEDAYFNTLNRLFKKPKNTNEEVSGVKMGQGDLHIGEEYEILDQGMDEWHGGFEYLGESAMGSTIKAGEHVFKADDGPGMFVFITIPDSDLKDLVR